MTNSLSNTKLLADIRQVLLESRQHLQRQVNVSMVSAYWQIGRLIVEEEQKGKSSEQIMESSG